MQRRALRRPTDWGTRRQRIPVVFFLFQSPSGVVKINVILPHFRHMIRVVCQFNPSVQTYGEYARRAHLPSHYFDSACFLRLFGCLLITRVFFIVFTLLVHTWYV